MDVPAAESVTNVPATNHGEDVQRANSKRDCPVANSHIEASTANSGADVPMDRINIDKNLDAANMDRPSARTKRAVEEPTSHGPSPTPGPDAIVPVVLPLHLERLVANAWRTEEALTWCQPAMMSRADERASRDTFPATAGSITEVEHVVRQLGKEVGGRRRPRRHSIGRMVALMDGRWRMSSFFYYY